MKFIDDIFSFVWDIGEWFYWLYYESQDIPIVGGVISYIFYSLYKVVWSLLTPIAHFGDWVDDIAAKVSNILSSVDIISLLRTWLTKADNAWDWILGAPQVILQHITLWWSTASQTVQVLVNEAKQYAAALVKDVSTALFSLQSAWDDFKGKIPSLEEVILWWGDWWAQILTPLTAWWNERLTEVDTLIDSTLKRWFPFYDDLVSLWGGIKLFFTDPEDWLYKSADRIIERFW